jgi:hypothetical protein
MAQEAIFFQSAGDKVLTRDQPQADIDSISAESIQTRLATSLSCKHFPKYRAYKQPTGRYPSRLGFFHSNSDAISYLDLKILCPDCVGLLLPGVYNVWSFLAAAGPNNAIDLASVPSSSEYYPKIYQLGSEASQEPAIIHIPDVPQAKAAWKWLQSEKMPFYIDSLHSVKFHEQILA